MPLFQVVKRKSPPIGREAFGWYEDNYRKSAYALPS